LGASGASKECITLFWLWSAAYRVQIRLVTNPYAGENAPNKKKYCGYAFIVFERESDMKGITSQ
jgi:hypothetical protein